MDKHYADTVRLLLNIAPDVFDNDIFAMKGGTAINLFLRDMPRLSVDIDVVYLPWQTPRDEALQAINQELAAIAQRVDNQHFGDDVVRPAGVAAEASCAGDCGQRDDGVAQQCNVAFQLRQLRFVKLWFKR